MAKMPGLLRPRQKIDEAELEATDIEPLGAPELTQLEAL